MDTSDILATRRDEMDVYRIARRNYFHFRARAAAAQAEADRLTLLAEAFRRDMRSSREAVHSENERLRAAK